MEDVHCTRSLLGSIRTVQYCRAVGTDGGREERVAEIEAKPVPLNGLLLLLAPKYFLNFLRP